jgi:hypothetical protein
MRSPVAFLVGFVVAASPVFAQQPPAETVTQVIRQKPKPGMEAQYEAGRKKHMAWHKAQKDPWAWNVYEITTGPDTGGYLIASGNHSWADIDTWTGKHGAADTADSASSIGPNSVSAEVSYWVQMNGISRPPPAGSQAPMLTLTVYYTKPGHDAAFTASVGKLQKMLETAKFPLHSVWYRLASGGEMPAYAVVTPRVNFAAMAPTPSLLEVVTKQVGEAETQKLSDEFFSHVSRVTSELLQRRDDLGYQPSTSN